MIQKDAGVLLFTGVCMDIEKADQYRWIPRKPNKKSEQDTNVKRIEPGQDLDAGGKLRHEHDTQNTGATSPSYKVLRGFIACLIPGRTVPVK